MTIAFRTAGSAAGAASAAVPIPPAVVPGDCLLLFGAANGGNMATPAGWQLVDTQTIGTALGGKVFTRVAQAGDAGGSVTVTNDLASGQRTIGLLAAYTGVDPVVPIHVQAARIENVSGTAHPTPSITTTVGHCEVVQAVLARDSTSVPPWSVPAGSVLRQQEFTGGTGQLDGAIADGNGPLAPGSYGGGSFTGSAATSNAITWTMALRPEIHVAPVFADAEAMVIGYLAGRSELSGVPVVAALAPANDGTQPQVVVHRIGGGYVEDEVLDCAWLRVETYGSSPTNAYELMRRVRATLPGLTGTYFPGSVISDVAEEMGGRGVRRSADPDRPSGNRYMLNLRLMIRLS